MAPKLRLLLSIAFLYHSFCSGQDIGQIGKAKLFSLTGGISANAIYYEGSSNRDPFTYFLNGNVNLNISGVYNIPFSFSYSNQDFGYSNPFTFNRLSMHPSYKWISTHIGDVNMTFSPYTLSGHQFTGFGVDLTPESPFKISAMYGRLLKATEYNEEEPNAIAAYDRYGFGFKTAYEMDKWSVGLIFFKANDRVNSLENPIPIELELSPKDNAVISVEGGIHLFDKAQLEAEYAISGITEDTRLTDQKESPGLLSFLIEENISTRYYNAFNASFTYPAGSGSVGATYERIDPEYRTFGAYFFNNDLENITANASQSIFNNKVNVSANVGLQRDNLNKTKSTELQRVVSAFNTSITASEKLSLNGSYSNFQSFTNIRDQFDYINEVGQFDNVDTLNYRQVTQNANAGANYTIKKTETKQQSSSLNLVYQNSKNLQNDVASEGGINSFYNGTAAYTLGYPKKTLNISLAANASYNISGPSESLTWGPTLSISKQFFDKKLRTNFSTSYNASQTDGEMQNSVFNIRLGSNYIWLEKHNFSLNLLTLFRNTIQEENTDFTATFGYSYSFDRLKLKLKRKLVAEEEAKKPRNYVSFRYRGSTYSGTISQVTRQLEAVFASSQFDNIPKKQHNKLRELLDITSTQKKSESYKESALLFLKELYSYEDFKDIYDNSIFWVIEKLQLDMIRLDEELEMSYVSKKTELDDEQSSETEKQKITKELEIAENRLIAHRWMQEKLNKITKNEQVFNAKGFLLEFKLKNKDAAFDFYDQEQNIDTIREYLEAQLIDFYYTKSRGAANPDSIEFRYIMKN